MRALKKGSASFLLQLVLLTSTVVMAWAVSDWAIPEEAKQAKNPEPANAESVTKGQQLYGKFCKTCHGDSGKGDGPMVEMLDVMPKPFDAEHLSGKTDGELFFKISTGKKPMPEFEKKIAEQDRWHLVNYVRSLAKSSSAANPLSQ